MASLIADIAKWIIGLASAGVILRIVMCLISIAIDPDKKQQQLQRIKNALFFLAICVSAEGLRQIIEKYFH